MSFYSDSLKFVGQPSGLLGFATANPQQLAGAFSGTEICLPFIPLQFR